ncbi:MAG: DJ-1/PfpI family protein, partial [Candidatus Eremiobacteraeota bacterium]|nr:DJ-1/PfpI family protein [Candidatus Eremiobacteraeota bacterium]
MNRSDLIRNSAAAGLLSAALPVPVQATEAKTPAPIAPLAPPAGGVPVAFLLSEGAVLIDFAGPWEVFHDADVAGRTQSAFNLYTVAETTKPLKVGGDLTIVPQYSFADAPAPNVVVVPAQAKPTAATKQWLIDTAKHADLVMSVCTGALVLAQAGLLDGHSVTTHHSAFTTLAMSYPKVTVVHGVRFVDDGAIATSAGLSAGIDLALHVVARYYGKETARSTAYDMEYQSNSWLDAANDAYRRPPTPPAGLATCPVCWMTIDPKISPSLSYGGKRYYFCMTEHEHVFASAPERFL